MYVLASNSLLSWVGFLSTDANLGPAGKNMAPEEAPDSCKGHGYAPMCCSNDGSVRSLLSKTQFENVTRRLTLLSLQHGVISACEPFAQVKEEYYRSFGYGQESTTDVIYDAVS